MEEWLILIAERLKSRGLFATPLFDDKYMGERPALDVDTGRGYLRLEVHKSPQKGAILRLFVESVAAGDKFIEALAGYHREIKRRENGKRKFIHRVETLARYLQLEYGDIWGASPEDDFQKLKKLFPESTILAGAAVGFRLRRKGMDEESAEFVASSRLKIRYFPAYAVRIQADSRQYLGVYVEAKNGFLFAEKALETLANALGTKGTLNPAVYGVANRNLSKISPSGKSEKKKKKEENSDSIFDLLDCIGCDDCGISHIKDIDLPDCDIVPLPDC